MLVFRHPDRESDDRRLAQLDDPSLTRRLRKINPHFFASERRWPIAFVLMTGVAAFFAGFIVEPMLFPAQHARIATMSAPKHNTIHAIAHQNFKRVVAVRVMPATHAVPQVLPQRTQTLPRTRIAPQVATRTQTQTKTQVQAQVEEQFWLRAQARARAADRARATSAVAVAAAIPQPIPDPVVLSQPPVTGPPVPGPLGQTLPRLPGGGGCHRGHGIGLSIGGHGLGAAIVNMVLQNVRVKGVPLGRP